MSLFRGFSVWIVAFAAALGPATPVLASETDGSLASNQAFFWKTGIYTTVAKTDFQGSWMRLASTERRETYNLAIHIVNVGALNVKNGYVDLVLADGWSYQSSDGLYDLVTTQEKAYGQEVRWVLPPLATNRSADITVKLHSDQAEGTPLLMAVTSEFSAPLYAELSTEDVRAARQSDLVYWLRYAWLMVRLSLIGLWDRFVTGVTLVAYHFQLSTRETT